MADNEIRFLGDLQRLGPRDGDRFVLTADRVLTPGDVARTRLAWREFAGGHAENLRLLILDGGMKLGVVKTSEASK